MTAELRIAVLAAGAGRRFGGAKLLAPLAGRPLLAWALEAARAQRNARVALVVGCRAAEVAAAVDLAGVEVVPNPYWREGIASSIRCAAASLAAGEAGLLLLGGDQPLVGAGGLASLIARWAGRPDRPAAARYCGVLGLPALFPRAQLAALEGLAGDRGARRLLAGATPCDLPLAALDVDTPEDLERAERLLRPK